MVKKIVDLLRNNFSLRNCQISSENLEGRGAVYDNIRRQVLKGLQPKYDNCNRKDCFGRGLILTLLAGTAVLAIIAGEIFLLKKPKEFLIKRETGSSEGDASDVSFAPGQLKWEKTDSPAPWSARDAHCAVVFKDKIWLLGGVEGGTLKGERPDYGDIPHKSDIWVSENGKDWQLVTDKAKWGQRRSMATVVFQDKLWLLAGWTKDFGETKNDVWVSGDGINWELAINSAPWSQREGHSAVVFKDKIWLLGGVNFYKREIKNDVWYSEDGKQWTRALENAPWSGRYDQTLTVFKDKLWLIGGLYFGGEVRGDVWVSGDGINWELATDSPPWTARHGHVTLDFKDNLWLISGWFDKPLNDVWYSGDGYYWQKNSKKEPWPGWEDHSGVVFGDKIWLLGGMTEIDKNFTWQNDIWHSQ